MVDRCIAAVKALAGRMLSTQDQLLGIFLERKRAGKPPSPHFTHTCMPPRARMCACLSERIAFSAHVPMLRCCRPVQDAARLHPV
jgi:hypothetical protein